CSRHSGNAGRQDLDRRPPCGRVGSTICVYGADHEQSGTDSYGTREDGAAMMMVNATRVLVVDDESQITQVLQTSLTARGYEVRSADDGDSALTVFRQWQPELVITDLAMPRVGGIALCHAI